MTRAAVFDWDVHHGNGTEAIFFEDPTVLYISTHQMPLYPGTGRADSKGAGAGEGYTLNLPLPSGAGDTEFLPVFEGRVLPAIQDFAPDCLLISAGFDGHVNDPLAGLRLTTDLYRRLAAALVDYAKGAGIPLVVVLEGGYDLEALGACIVAVAGEMLRAHGMTA